jgi:NAD(P)-dependent dehydrogenase (short-subunit alcohol dehydrogenase family)
MKIVITGANRGIGLALARHLAATRCTARRVSR